MATSSTAQITRTACISLWTAKSHGHENLEAFMNHKKLKLFIALLLGICSTAASLAGADRSNFPSACHRPELEYLKAVN